MDTKDPLKNFELRLRQTPTKEVSSKAFKRHIRSICHQLRFVPLSQVTKIFEASSEIIANSRIPQKHPSATRTQPTRAAQTKARNELQTPIKRSRDDANKENEDQKPNKLPKHYAEESTSDSGAHEDGDLVGTGETEKFVLQILAKLKPLRGGNTSVLKSIMTAVVLPFLTKDRNGKPRSKHWRELKGVYEGTFTRAKEVRQMLINSDSSVIQVSKQTREHERIIKIQKLLIQSLDRYSTPVKFSTTNKRRLNTSLRQVFELFSADFKEMLDDYGGVSWSKFRDMVPKTYMKHASNTFNNCATHNQAEDALNSFKSLLQSVHPAANCNINNCEKCAITASFPSNVHAYYNKIFAACTPRSPALTCADNECQRCERKPGVLVETLEKFGVDVDEIKQELVYMEYAKESRGTFNLIELKYFTGDPRSVIGIWENQMFDVLRHQYVVFRSKEIGKSLCECEHPKLPTNSSVADIDYAENYQLCQMLMVKAMKFAREMTSGFQCILDTPWGNVRVDHPDFKPPQCANGSSSIFRDKFLRIAMSHFRDGTTPKHNGQTGADSLDRVITYAKSIAKENQLKSIIVRSDNSPKEFGASTFLIELTKLALKHNTKLIHVFSAEHHGATPCDAEQRYVKNMCSTIGATSTTFRDNLTSLIDHINSPTGQPSSSDHTLTTARRAFLIPEMKVSESKHLAAKNTRLYKVYFTTDEIGKLGRRRFLCLDDCCNITNQQSDTCKNNSTCGKVEFITYKKKPEYR